MPSAFVRNVQPRRRPPLLSRMTCNQSVHVAIIISSLGAYYSIITVIPISKDFHELDQYDQHNQVPDDVGLAAMAGCPTQINLSPKPVASMTTGAKLPRKRN